MEKFIPIGKMSKKARRKIERAKRNTWGPINPVTHRVESKKIYNRKKVRLERNDFYHAELFSMVMIIYPYSHRLLARARPCRFPPASL